MRTALIRTFVILVIVMGSTVAYATTACPSNAVCVSDLATGGAGTAASPWTGWETSVNALGAYTHVHFPGGYYSQGSKITMKKGWLVTGDGSLSEATVGTGGSTYIMSSFTGTAFYFSATGNGDRGSIRIEHLTIANSNSSNLGSAILTRLTGIVHISNVWIEGFSYGYTNLGTTAWSVTNSTFEYQKRIAIWNSTGADYKSPYADEDLSGTNYAFQNDNASILNCNFNHNGANANGGTVTAAIVLESTYANTIDHCKFNGADHAIWITASVGVRISGSTFEVQQSQMIDLRQSRFLSGTASGYSGGTVISNNVGTVSASGVHFIYADQHADLTLLNNSYGDNNTGLSMVHSSSGTGISTLNAFGNSYGSGGLCDSTPGSGIYADYGVAGVVPEIILTGRLNLHSGINQPVRMGTDALSGGTVTVSNTSVTAKTRVWYFRKSIGGTPGQMSYTVTAGTGFTLTSTSGSDTSTYDWFLVEGP
jgi:hypothetical protein